MAQATSATIEQILGLPALMTMVELTTSGLPQEKFLPKRWKEVTKEVIGNSMQAVLTKGQRKVSRVIQYNAPPVGATLETLGQENWIAIATSEEMDIDPVTFQRLRNYDNWTEQKLGAEEIARQVGLFVKKEENLVSSCILFMLAQGVCYFDSFGNLSPTQVAGSYNPPVSMNIPATNQGQLPYPAGASVGLIAAPWSNPTADIPLHIKNIIAAALQATGYEPTDVFYGKNIPQYLAINSYIEEYMSRNETMNGMFLSTGEIPAGFLGLNWIPAWKAFYEDQTQTNQQIWGADLCTFAPQPDKYWYEMALGSMQVPTTIDIQTSVEAAMANIRLVYGKFIYAYMAMKPIRLQIVMGNTFLPTIKVPLAVWQATVNF